MAMHTEKHREPTKNSFHTTQTHRPTQKEREAEVCQDKKKDGRMDSASQGVCPGSHCDHCVAHVSEGMCITRCQIAVQGKGSSSRQRDPCEAALSCGQTPALTRPFQRNHFFWEVPRMHERGAGRATMPGNQLIPDCHWRGNTESFNTAGFAKRLSSRSLENAT